LAFVICDTDFLIKISNDPLPKVNLKEFLRDKKLIVLPSVFREIKGLEKSKSPTVAKRARRTRQVLKESQQFELISEREVILGSLATEAEREIMEFVMEKPEERTAATLDGSFLSCLERKGLPYITLSRGKLFIRFRQ
jgi:rRNA-processing protein FCF1